MHCSLPPKGEKEKKERKSLKEKYKGFTDWSLLPFVFVGKTQCVGVNYISCLG